MRHLTPRLGALAGSMALVLGVGAPSSAEPLPMPTAIYALGDSITVAYDVNRLLVEEPAYSWSTGTVASVNSVYARLEAKDPSTTSIASRQNVAKSGAKMIDLAGQVANAKVAATPGAELVTILMGANDACTKTEAGMTAVGTFQAQIVKALNDLEAKGVDQVVVASIPNIFQLWDVGRRSSTARLVWSVYGICQSMLANPWSTSSTDMARRYRVRDRVTDFNLELQKACAAVEASAAPTRCRFDGNEVFNTAFSLTDISRVDYFHPSASGQAKLAAAVYKVVEQP